MPPPQIPSVWCDYVKLFNSVPWPPTPLITVISTQWPGLYLSVTMNMPSWVWGLAGLSSFPLPSPAPELVNWRPAWEAAGGCQGHEVRKPARTEALGWVGSGTIQEPPQRLPIQGRVVVADLLSHFSSPTGTREGGCCNSKGGVPLGHPLDREWGQQSPLSLLHACPAEAAPQPAPQTMPTPGICPDRACGKGDTLLLWPVRRHPEKVPAEG